MADGPKGVVYTATWDARGHKGKWLPGEIPARLAATGDWLIQLLADLNVKRAVVEEVSVSHNMDTVRKIAYFESVCMLSCAMLKLPVLSVKTTSARKAVLGKGNLKKEQAHPMLEKLAGRGLMPDEADALLFAYYPFCKP